MANVAAFRRQLEKELARSEAEAARLRATLGALDNLKKGTASSKPRTMSAAARKKIAEPQRRRWAQLAQLKKEGKKT
jgi:hypothetical protein